MIKIETNTDCAEITYKDDFGATIVKSVSLDDLATVFAAKTKLSTGILPLGTRSYERAANSEYLVVQTAPRIQEVTYAGSGKFTIPFPGLAFFLKLTADSIATTTKRITVSKVYALNTPLVDATTPLFRFPYGNIHSSGDVCWGSVAPPPVTSAKEITAIIESFYGSIFNGDLDHGAFTPFNDPENENVRIIRAAHLMRFLNGAQEFPVPILATAGKTFGEVERSMKLNGN